MYPPSLGGGGILDKISINHLEKGKKKMGNLKSSIQMEYGLNIILMGNKPELRGNLLEF